jgi:hypothetical protein
MTALGTETYSMLFIAKNLPPVNFNDFLLSESGGHRKKNDYACSGSNPSNRGIAGFLL